MEKVKKQTPKTYYCSICEVTLSYTTKYGHVRTKNHYKNEDLKAHMTDPPLFEKFQTISGSLRQF